MKKNDIAEIVILDISTAHIGEYMSVKILKVVDNDVLISDAMGRKSWVTRDHLELVDD
jgi:hypothetical protein